MKRYGNRYHGCRVNEFGWRNQQLIVIENELLRIGVVPTKGADILEFRYKPRDLDVLWHAPQNLFPNEYEPVAARDQGVFLDYFSGGWQEVFPNAGPATVYEGAALGQHGEVALLPWDVAVTHDTAELVQVEFTVETNRTPFRLTRSMSLSSGSAVLRMKERITNLGMQRLPYAWGHHPAFGAPFLSEGCVIETESCVVSQTAYAKDLARRFALQDRSAYPNMESARGGVEPMNLVLGPQACTQDVLLCHELSAGWCAVRNPAEGLAVRLDWDKEIFPYLWMWQVYGGAFGYPYYGRVYTLAIEPFNCPIMPLAEAAAKGLVPELAPGESVETMLQCGILATP
jgi:galactose mutarotase-like enzyme